MPALSLRARLLRNRLPRRGCRLPCSAKPCSCPFRQRY